MTPSWKERYKVTGKSMLTLPLVITFYLIFKLFLASNKQWKNKNSLCESVYSVLWSGNPTERLQETNVI